MKKKMMAFGLALVSLATGIALASSGSPSISPDEALRKLRDGNKRYVENKLTIGSRSDTASRTALANSQGHGCQTYTFHYRNELDANSYTA